MPKPAPERLLLETYPVRLEVPPRFGDVDALRHLNNVAIARIYEDARIRFLDQLALRDRLEPKHGFVIAELAIRYLAEGGYPDMLTVGTGVGRVGSSSFTLGQGLFQNGRCIGVAESVIVHVSRSEGGARPLPEAARAVFVGWELAGA